MSISRARLLRPPEAWTDVDLVAALVGEPGLDGAAQRLARRLLGQHPSLAELARMASVELAEGGELARDRAVRLWAAFELGRRAIDRPFRAGDRLSSPGEVAERLRHRLAEEPVERFLALAVDARLNLLGEELIALGGVASVHVRPREAFRPLLGLPASAVIFAHNHPTGDPEPSDDDVLMTRRLVLAGEILGIRVLDHLVVARGGFVSLRERGVVPGGRELEAQLAQQLAEPPRAAPGADDQGSFLDTMTASFGSRARAS